jgi:hypothetical protein
MGTDFATIPHGSDFFQQFANLYLCGSSHVRSLRRRLHLRHHSMCPDAWLSKGYQVGIVGQKLLIFMHFHKVFLGNQHKMWSKQHNEKSDFFLHAVHFSLGSVARENEASRVTLMRRPRVAPPATAARCWPTGSTFGVHVPAQAHASPEEEACVLRAGLTRGPAPGLSRREHEA